MAFGESRLTIRRENTKCGVRKTSIKKATHDLLRFFAFIRIDTNTDELTSGFNNFWVAELTVLRTGISGSEDTRNPTTLGSHCHKKDGPVAPLRLLEPIT